MELNVETNEGMEHTLQLEDQVPADIGRKTRMKITASASGDEEGTEEFEIEDAIGTKERAKQFLVNNMLKESDEDLRAEDLTLASYDKIARNYWDQIQGKKKVNENS